VLFVVFCRKLLVCRSNHSLDSGSKAGRQVGTGAEMSLSLCGLQTEVMTVVGMVHLNETALGEGESLSRCSVGLEFHDKYFLSGEFLTNDGCGTG
jgi:hypothetical protein